jgi:cytochrome bd-type quinol oxidase subunit 2
MARLEDSFINLVQVVSKKKKLVVALKITAVVFLAFATILAFNDGAFAAGDEIVDVHPVLDLINKLVNPLLLLVGAGGVIFCIIMGVKYATAEEPQEREKRKQALKTAIIGYLLIFVLVVLLKLSIGPLTDWMTKSTTGTTATK